MSNKLILICALFLLFIYNIGYSQFETANIKHYHYTDDCYKSFKIRKDKIWLLTLNNSIIALDINSGNLLLSLPSYSNDVVSWDIDTIGQIIIGDSSSIMHYNRREKKWQKILTHNLKQFSLVHDSKNNHYAVSLYGIFEFSSTKLNAPIHIIQGMERYVKFSEQWKMGLVCIKQYDPSITYMDSHDNFWVGFDKGEWGSGVNLLDLRRKAFITNKLTGSRAQGSVRGFAENDSVIYFSSSLSHFGLSGGITKVSNFNYHPIFNVGMVSEPYDSIGKRFYKYRFENENQYLGPIAYNPKDSCLYIYSQNGIFKGNPMSDLTNLNNWKKAMTTKFKWDNHGQRHAVGSPVNMLQMEFTTNGILIFLTENDGLGIFKNNILTMVK